MERQGTVAVFDDAAGVGEVEADDGTRYFFHCTQIADGTRTIAVGATVAFVLAPGHRGQYEARRITPV